MTSPAATILLLAALMPGIAPLSFACDARAPTPATDPGPHDFSTATAETSLWREGDDGEPLILHARVLDTCGKPVEGALVRLLHADQHGYHDPDRWRAHLMSDERGEFKVLTVYPGYAGYLPRHIHFIISHPDHRELITRLFFKNDPSIQQDTEALAIVVEEVWRGGEKGWIGGYEFVLPPK